MNSVLFCTENEDKFATAKSVFEKAGLDLEQVRVDVPEFQSENPKEDELIKAKKP